MTETGTGTWDCKLENEKKKSKSIFTYTAQTAGKQYLFIEAEDAETITVSQEKKDDKIEIRNDCGSIVNLGEMDSGTEFKVTVEYNEGKIGKVVSHVCTMDDAIWQDTYQILSESMLQVTEYTDSSLTGTYENGWTLKVDGRTREINELAGGAWISTSLSAGEHEIELSFRPPGLLAGLGITLGCIALLIAAEMLRRRRSRRRTAPAPETLETLETPENVEVLEETLLPPATDESTEEFRDLL